MLVNKQLGYENNSNLSNNVEIDEGYRQKKIIALSRTAGWESYHAPQIYVIIPVFCYKPIVNLWLEIEPQKIGSASLA